MSVSTHIRIKWWRERLNLTQAELGARCGLHQTKICRLESGRARLAADDLELIVREGLKTTIAEFYRARAA